MNRLRAIRKESGMTQEELADKLHLKRSVISKYENGLIPLTDSLIIELSRLFGVSAGYLLGEPDDTPPPGEPAPTELQWGDFAYALYNETEDLTDEQKQSVLAFARFVKTQRQQRKDKNGQPEKTD